VDGTGSGSCPVASFGISGVEPSGSAVSVLAKFYSKAETSRFLLM
jgi:hypothetical protein